jgi:hypothetical protein
MLSFKVFLLAAGGALLLLLGLIGLAALAARLGSRRDARRSRQAKQQAMDWFRDRYRQAALEGLEEAGAPEAVRHAYMAGVDSGLRQTPRTSVRGTDGAPRASIEDQPAESNALPETIASAIAPVLASARPGHLRVRLHVWVRIGTESSNATEEGSALLSRLSGAGWRSTFTSYQIKNRATGQKRHVQDSGFSSPPFDPPMDETTAEALAEAVRVAVEP